MNCSNCRQNIDLLLLDALTPAEAQALQQHLDGCPACRGEQQTATELVLRLGELRRASALGQLREASLRQRLQAEIRAAKQARSPGHWFLLWTRAAAALAILAVGYWSLVRHPTTSQPTGMRHLAWQYSGISGNKELVDNYPFVTENGVLALDASDSEKRIVCLDRASGALRWRTEFPVSGALLCSDDARVFAFSAGREGTRELLALDAGSGNLLWNTCSQPGARRSSPGGLVLTGGLVCWTDGPTVVAVDSHTGQHAWTSKPGRRSTLSAPVVVGSALYMASDEGVFALDRRDGHQIWRTESENRSSVRHLAFPPLVRCDGDRLVVAERRLVGQCGVHCHDLNTGTLHWQREITAPVHALTIDGNVYIRSSDIIALNGNTGAPTWSAKVGGCGTLAMAGGVLYAVEGRETPLVLALDPRTGRETWNQRLAGSCNGLVILGNIAYFSAHNGSLYALNMTESTSG